MRTDNAVQNYETYERLFGTEVQLFFVLGLIVLIVGFLSGFIKKETSPQAVIIVGVALVVIAGIALWGTEQMKLWVVELAVKGRIREAFKEDFMRRSNWFLYIFPFVSAAIGTNLISDALTKRLEYKNELTVAGFLRNCWFAVSGTVGLALLFVALPLIFVAIIWQQGKKSGWRAVYFFGRAKRCVYLKFLKYTIILRRRRRDDGGAV